ncbi:MAG TPA: phage gp6-like head-tail connector protein [Kribbellaceae bacterium]|nr:phage gp6-like head-tail connector protein [Kribbellaceae bacterium]
MVWKPDYVTLAELRDYATRTAEVVDDAYLAIAATAASRAVDRHTGRQFGKVDAAQARRYTARWDRRRRRWVVEIDDLFSAAGLTVAVEAGPVDVFELEPTNALLDGKVYERLIVEPESVNQPTGRTENEVTATTDKWGWSAFPAAVKQATLLQGSRLSWRRDAPAGVAGSPDQGSEIRLLARLDPDVSVALGDYVRWWGAG